jgi:hypothetical protein
MPSTQQASDLYNRQQAATGQMIADLLAQGDALKAGAQGGHSSVYEGGSPGYYWDNSPAVNAQYDTIKNDVNNLFGQATGIIRGQAAGIQQGTDSRVADLSKIISAAGVAAGQRGTQNIADQNNAAAAMGISAAPQNARAGGLANAIGSYRGSFGALNNNFTKDVGKIALQRNEAQAGAFDYANQQQQNQIQAARARALADAQIWVPGSRGRLVSSGSKANAADRKLVSAINKEQKAIRSAQSKDAAQRAKDPSIRSSAVQANRRLT